MLIAGGIAAYVHFHRFDGGPLRDPSYGGASGVLEVGRSISFPVDLRKSGDGDVRIESVRALRTTRTTSLRFWAMARSDAGQAVWGPFPPTDTNPGDVVPAKGFVIRNGEAHLIVEIRATGPGCAGFSGLRIRYRSGWRRYQKVARVLTARGFTPHARGCKKALPEEV